MVYGVLLLIGALAGRGDPLQPLAGLGRGNAAPDAAAHVEFARVKTLADLERELAAARAAGQPAMLDFYADWCVSCKEMERFTFTDAGVQAEFARARLLQADVTANDADDQALLSTSASSARRPSCSSTPPGASARNTASWASRRRTSSGPHLAAAFGRRGRMKSWHHHRRGGGGHGGRRGGLLQRKPPPAPSRTRPVRGGAAAPAGRDPAAVRARGPRRADAALCRTGRTRR